MTRRTFIHGMAAAGVLVSMPQFLKRSGVRAAHDLSQPTPAHPFMDWFGVDHAPIERVLRELGTGGADTADLYFQHQRLNSIVLEDGTISRASSRIQQGVGIRSVVGDQTGYAFTEDISLPSMLAAAQTAAAIAKQTRRVPPIAFHYKQTGDLYHIQVPWSDVGIEQKLPLLRRVEALAKAADPAVEKVRIYWADADERVMIAGLDGSIVTDHRPMTRVSLHLTARKNGQVQTGGTNIAARQDLSWYTEERLRQLVSDAVERTLILFEARRPPAGELPVILAAGASGILLHEAIGHGLEADFNRKGVSIYSDMLGKKVAEPFVTVVDQASLPHERGALNYDDEGKRCGRTVLVENGVLGSYLHDSISARHYKRQPTGSGRRQSYKHAPLPRMTCTFMEDGPHSREEIIGAVQNGIIAETYSNGQVRIGAGDFTFFIKNGWLVENGKITAPIKDCNIIGNGPEALTKISMVANDGRLDTGGWTCGKDGQSVPVSQGMPTVLVSSLTVGGVNAG
jgi:TldD protein